METKKHIHWKELTTGLLVGAILGIGGTFYIFNSRITRLEATIEFGGKAKEQTNSSFKDKIIIEHDGKEVRTIFNETFDDNVLGWTTYNNNDATKSISDGKYIISNKIAGVDRWGAVPISELPTNYNIHVKCRFISGSEKDKFGIILLQNIGSDYRFNITKNGYASVSLIKDTIGRPDLIIPKAGFKNSETGMFSDLLIEVRGDRYRYYVDDNLVGAGFINELKIKDIGVYVTDIQTVEFDNIKIMQVDI
jgi:hypothetical protein